MLRRRAARTIMLVCSAFARLPRYDPSAPGIVRHRGSARLGPDGPGPAGRDSLRYRLTPRRVSKIGLLIRRSPTAGHRAALAALLLSGQPSDVLDQDALGRGCRWTPDVDAFSLPFHDRPVVLATDKNDRARSRSDGGHELGHLVMHGEHVWGLKQVESQAHAFAAAFLMPDRDIRDELPSYADWPTLFDLKRRWQVSLAALLLRAKNLGRMTDASYLTAVKALSARGWRRQEPIPSAPPRT